MIGWKLILLTVVSVVVVATFFLESRLKRGRRRSLASTFKGDSLAAPAKKPALGLEAIDIAAFNRVVAENSGMAKVTGHNRWKWHSHTAAHSQPPVPLADDETYAARFHNAFGKTNEDTNDRS